MTQEILNIEASCHCGRLQLKITAPLPEKLTSCNCSICRRYGSLMAYFPPSAVEVIGADHTDEYSYGEKSLAFVRCKTCGCHSHWRSLDPNFTERMGVNARLFTNLDISQIRIRRFDGADTWKFLD